MTTETTSPAETARELARQWDAGWVPGSPIERLIGRLQALGAKRRLRKNSRA